MGGQERKTTAVSVASSSDMVLTAYSLITNKNKTSYS